jgi:hypothetical protein
MKALQIFDPKAEVKLTTIMLGCQDVHRIARPIPQHRHLDATRTVFWGGFF